MEKMEKNEKSKGSVLILGCGLLQKPSFLAAKSLSLKIFSVDADKNALCVPLSDSFKQIDLKDREGIYEFAKYLKENENLLGIFTAGTDFSASVSYASEKLGLPSHSFEASLNASIKSRMRECFKKNGVPSPNFYYASDSVEKGVSFVKEIGFPCVVKPCDNMGARGCRLIRNEEEVLPSINAAIENSRTRSIIIEEYMEGPEFSIDALVYDGTVTITGFADRHIFYPPYFIETGHTMPSVFDPEKKNELIKTFALGIKALGLTAGAAKADIKYTSKGPEIGEIAARLSGGYMSGWTYPYSSDFPLTLEALKIACGIEPDILISKRKKIESLKFSESEEKPFEIYEVPSVKTSAERAWISIPGKIEKIIGLEEACSSDESSGNEGVMNVFPRPVKEGGEVDFPRNNVQKCGNVISLSNDHENAVRLAEEKASSVLIRLSPNNQKTEEFLAGKEDPSEKGFPPSAFSSYEKLSSMLGCQTNIPKSATENALAIEAKTVPNIPENKSVVEAAPSFIRELLLLPEKGFNYKTALEEAELFDKIAPTHLELDGKRFWLALFKGGIQGALYVSDSEEKNDK